MVTSFYIMKMSQKQHINHDICVYYSNFYNKFQSVRHIERITKNNCRVCLQEGDISMYGSENLTSFADILYSFGIINTCESDNLPKSLCYTCHKFLNTALVFKKIALKSDEILKQHLSEKVAKNQSVSLSDEIYDGVDNHNRNNTKQEWPDDDSNDNTVKSIISVESQNEKLKLCHKITCEVCSKVINRSYYKQHMTMHDPDHKKYVCDVCGKSFRLRCAYHNHSLRHGNDFPFKCQVCPYRGRYSELLKTHMRTHTGDYRYMCSECPARFLFKSNLNSHMLKHKEPQFNCDSCKRAFHTKNAQQKHFQADHLGIKNHICTICCKAFGYRNTLMKHQRQVHNKEKLFIGRMPSYLEAKNKTNL